MNSSFYLNFSLKFISNFLIILGVGIFIFTYAPLFYSEIGYLFGNHTNSANITVGNEVVTTAVEALQGDDSLGIDNLDAVNTDFAVVIPKIDVNAPVIEDVSMADYDEYMEALRSGVAHARGTSLPGQEGNMFLFAHSSLNFWELGPYATVFNLLNKLESGDLVLIVKDGESHLYKVNNTRVVPGWDTEPFYTETDEPTLTMITCYPPGTTINRFVVTATYVGEQK